MSRALIGEVTYDVHWVGDRENGLAHLVIGDVVYGDDIAMCGVDVEDASEKLAKGRPRCSICQEGLDNSQDVNLT